MKKIMQILLIFVLALIFGQLGEELRAQESGETTATSPEASDRVVVVNPESVIKQKPTNVFVESGSDVIVGQPEENPRAAYRTWKTACDQWKSELKTNNRENLLIASCGSPQKRVEKVDVNTLYIFESKSTYKIRVGCD